jgi:predicted nicotinamide N-methyase
MDDALGRFDLTTYEVVVGSLRLSITHPRSAEELIDETEYEHDERLPYWAELWPSALVLAEHLAARDLRGRRVIELGCGIGLPAIVAALAGADVLATDWYADALAFTRANAAAAGAAVQTLLVDWTAPPPELLAMPAADLVVGADVLYEERNGPALAALVPRLLAPSAELVVADPRRPHAAGLLDRLIGGGWSLSTTDVRHGGRVDESGPIVHLHRLTAPVPTA